MSKLRLSHLLVALTLIWVGSCVAIHGPAILAYVALQAVTSGVFAYAIQRSLKKHHASPQKPQVRLTSDSDPARLEPATARQAG